jgi:hypothetical protein
MSPTIPLRRSRGRLRLPATLVAGVVLGLALAACQPIVVSPDGVTSQATMAASPTTTTVGGKQVAAVEIRMRDCHTARYEGAGAPAPPRNEIHLRPVASVTDAAGKVLFANFRAQGSEDHVVPPGSRIVDGGSGRDPHRIVVPVAGATMPLEIGAACTMYGGAGSGGPFGTWSFPTCTAWRRICLATDPGEGEWSD